VAREVARAGSAARLGQFAPGHELDVDLALMPAGLREAVGHLKPPPGFGPAAKRLVVGLEVRCARTFRKGA